jgi:hypothetical protein
MLKIYLITNFIQDFMQKITELLNAVGNCLCGAAKLFEEYNNFRESSAKSQKCLENKTDDKKKKC